VLEERFEPASPSKSTKRASSGREITVWLYPERNGRSILGLHREVSLLFTAISAHASDRPYLNLTGTATVIAARDGDVRSSTNR
jgi:hypothetical protein